VEEERSMLEELKGTEEGDALREKSLWKKAALRAKGEKLKDDPKRIRATLKKKEKSKQKSAQHWKERKGSMEKDQRERQERRQRNIDEAIKKKKERKHGKKGRAGFEGRGKGFINKN